MEKISYLDALWENFHVKKMSNDKTMKNVYRCIMGKFSNEYALFDNREKNFKVA